MSSQRTLRILHSADDPAPDRLLKVAEVARLMGLGVSTVYHLCQRGALPSVRIPGTTVVRVSERALRDFIAAGGAR